MKNKKRCNKCILSGNFPKIEFNENGVCNYCTGKNINNIDDKIVIDSMIKINNLIDEYRGKSEYDAIVCFSGGKDSTYTLYLAKEKYNLKTLSFTLDNGFIAESAWKNIDTITNNLGVDHIIIKPSFKFFKELIKVSAFNNIYPKSTITRISSVCNSCISIVNNLALKMALEKQINIIFAGFNLGQIPSNSIVYQNNYHFLTESRKPVLEKLKNKLGKKIEDYFCIRNYLLNNIKSFPYTVNLLCIENINENDIIDKIKKLGWIQPDDLDGCTSNCILNTFNNYMHEKKYGYNPYELELSKLIRKNKLTRDEALKKVNLQPKKQLEYVIKLLNLKKTE